VKDRCNLWEHCNNGLQFHNTRQILALELCMSLLTYIL
jgi:hypothetical protein